MQIPPPEPQEMAPYYRTYIKDMPKGDLMPQFSALQEASQALLAEIPQEKGSFRYAEGKWSIKQVIQHLIDVEWIMSTRALRIARGEEQALSGFDQEAYADMPSLEEVPLADLASEWKLLRGASQRLFSRFRQEELLRAGEMSGRRTTVRAIAYIILGHELHHIRLIKERYLL